MKQKPKTAPSVPVPSPEAVAAKLRALDALRRKVQDAAAGAKPKRRQRFSGSWGCG